MLIFGVAVHSVYLQILVYTYLLLARYTISATLLIISTLHEQLLKAVLLNGRS